MSLPEARALLHRLRTALIDRYAVRRELGRGGMATVYLATDVKHERVVALKVLKPEPAAVLLAGYGPSARLRQRAPIRARGRDGRFSACSGRRLGDRFDRSSRCVCFC